MATFSTKEVPKYATNSLTIRGSDLKWRIKCCGFRFNNADMLLLSCLEKNGVMDTPVLNTRIIGY